MATKIEAVDTRPVCGKCGSRVIYVRIDGSIVCRRCGAITHPKI